MDPADLIEENLDHLIYWMEVWVMTHVDEAINNPEKLKIIQEFVEWCGKEAKEALDSPRTAGSKLDKVRYQALDGKSFRQRREETPGWWKIPTPEDLPENGV